MDKKQLEQQIIQNYKNEEQTMILIFAQWCINHNLDPSAIYQKAYPDQVNNRALEEAIASTVPKQEAQDIPNQTLIDVLSVFGNEDLAFVVTEEIEK
ncbi:hypothetical protein [Thalassobacillus pellis]|uniref:hypothetical protein n=1 Tax=Thalassobacillus pellis TaxID=748008 RepID=UPI00195F5B0E|nr:hypothetical protein [Thalassobacillus pellis]MBM7552576.1 hypothetical protein [Thalassobacillus pellis]